MSFRRGLTSIRIERVDMIFQVIVCMHNVDFHGHVGSHLVLLKWHVAAYKFVTIIDICRPCFILQIVFLLNRW